MEPLVARRKDSFGMTPSLRRENIPVIVFDANGVLEFSSTTLIKKLRLDQYER